MKKDYCVVDPKAKNLKVDKGSTSSSGIVASFRAATSVFSKKLQKWRKKKKVGSNGGQPGAVTLREKDVNPRNWVMGFDRRPVDAESPRLSLDAGQRKWDKPRRSFDNPRSSCDGHLIGGRALRQVQFMDSFLDDSHIAIRRLDNKIPVELPQYSTHKDPEIPGGSLQTREYYMDSPSQRRHQRLERSKLAHNAAALIISEAQSAVLNSKVSPAIPDCMPRSRTTNSRLPNLHSKSLREDRFESFESIYRGISASQSASKKSGWWRFWGLAPQHDNGSTSSKEEDNDNNMGNVVDRCMSETRRSEVNGQLKGAFDPTLFRSSTVTSSRSSLNYNAFGSMRYPVESNRNDGNRRDGILSQMNQSARHSSIALDKRGNRSSDFSGLSKKSDSSAWRPPWFH